MKLKILACLTSILVLLAGVSGMVVRRSYKDFNDEENPLDRFLVGIMFDEMIDQELATLEKGDDSGDRRPLSESNLIVAVLCENGPEFRYRCIMQKASILKVFKGEELLLNNSVFLTNYNTDISYFEDEPDSVKELIGFYSANLGFASEMIPGKVYLVFLERKVDTETAEEIWLYEKGLMAARFCYEEITNHPAIPIGDYYHGAFYGDIKENEFFLESEESIQKMAEFKEKMLQMYPLKDRN